MAKKPISDTPIRLNIEPISKLVILEQGKSIISMTYEQITALKQLSEGVITAYRSPVYPVNTFKLMTNRNILCECKESESIVLLRSDTTRNDVEALMVLLDSNKGNIARNKDIKRR